MGTGAIMQRDDSVRQHYRTSWLYGASQHPHQQKNEQHLSAFICLPPFPMLDEHTLHYAHLQSNEETTVWTCAFSLCMSPTLQMAVSILNSGVAHFATNVFYGRCSVFIWLPFLQLISPTILLIFQCPLCRMGKVPKCRRSLVLSILFKRNFQLFL